MISLPESQRYDKKPVIRSPDNTWRNGFPKYFGDPVPECSRFAETNAICRICMRDHAPITPTKEAMSQEATKLSPELKKRYKK